MQLDCHKKGLKYQAAKTTTTTTTKTTITLTLPKSTSTIYSSQAASEGCFYFGLFVAVVCATKAKRADKFKSLATMFPLRLRAASKKLSVYLRV